MYWSPLATTTHGIPVAAFDGLGLVQDHVLPLDPLEVLDVLHHQLVAGDEHVEGRVLLVQQLLVPVLAYDLPLLGAAPIRQCLQ